MTLTISAQSCDGTMTVDLTTAPYSIEFQGIDRGRAEYTSIGEQKARRGERTSAIDRELRTMSWTQVINDENIDDLNSAYTNLKDIICQNRWILILNAGGVTEQNKYYDCYSVVDIPRFDTLMSNSAFYKYEIKFKAEPFSRGPTIDLPRNYLKDALMTEVFSTTGLPQSFIVDESPVSPLYTKGIESYGTYFQMTDASDVGQYCGMTQTMTSINAEEIWSFAIQYKCTAASNAIYDIYIDFGNGNKTYLVENQTIAQSEWVWAKIDNITVPIGTTSGTLVIRITSITSGSVVAQLWTRRGMAVEANAIPLGKDGGPLFYVSEVLETPATLLVDNMPGDAPATAIIQIASTVPNTGFVTAKINHIWVGVLGTTEEVTSLIDKGPLDVADVHCLGGYYTTDGYSSSPAKAGANGDMLSGKYYVISRTRTDDVGAVSTTRSITQQVGVQFGSEFVGPAINIYADAGPNMWTFGQYGPYSYPLRKLTSWANIQDEFIPVFSGTGTDNVDYVAYMPLQQYFRCNVEPPASSYTTLVSDSQDKTNPGIYAHYNTGSAYIQDPFVGDNGTQHYMPLTAAREGAPLEFATGKTHNVMMIVCTAYLDSIPDYNTKSGAIMIIQYTPRYFD